jgi:outer membrane receptor for ferrienterochelin and colicin
VESIIRSTVNLAAQYVDNFDLRTSYSFDYQDWGRFTVAVNGNYYTRWEYQGSPTSLVVDARGSSNSTSISAPPLAKWKASANLSWFRGNHAAGLVTRYIDNMIFDETALTTGFAVGDIAEIRPITKVDARYSYRFTLWDVDTNMTFGITNLFDRDAQRLPVQNGLETRIDDPFGRQYYASMDFEF